MSTDVHMKKTDLLEAGVEFGNDYDVEYSPDGTRHLVPIQMAGFPGFPYLRAVDTITSEHGDLVQLTCAGAFREWLTTTFLVEHGIPFKTY